MSNMRIIAEDCVIGADADVRGVEKEIEPEHGKTSMLAYSNRLALHICIGRSGVFYTPV